jgi:hypothetical protein
VRTECRPSAPVCRGAGGYLSVLWSTESKKAGCTSAASGRSAQWGVVRGFGARKRIGRGTELPRFKNGLTLYFVHNEKKLSEFKKNNYSEQLPQKNILVPS